MTLIHDSNPETGTIALSLRTIVFLLAEQLNEHACVNDSENIPLTANPMCWIDCLRDQTNHC